MRLSPENYFFVIFISLILILRLFLYLKPTPGPTIAGFRVHHWLVGLILIVLSIALFLTSLNKKIPLTFFAIGLAMFVDELTYLLIGGETHADNYSPVSLIGTLLFIIMIFVIRKHIVTALYRINQT